MSGTDTLRGRLRARRPALSFAAGAAMLAMLPAQARQALRAEVEELSRMSLEELANVEVTSVSKEALSLRSAPAAIYVVTREEIIRMGAASIPEALRLAPNLQVARLDATTYAITSRGFGDKREVQTQANKLLILVDGRTVYSPLFSGVFYDAIDLPMDDVDRIEVISGPGATLWGANAMNGVINIITRASSETQGALVHLTAGDGDHGIDARYGGRLGQQTSYRVYGKAFERDSLELADGSSAGDRWNKTQGGLRLDWRDSRHSFTFQGDAYEADESLPGVDDLSISGANALARWERATERSQLMVQAYYDRTDREATPEGAAFVLNTYDIELQHGFTLGSRHRVVWGAGKRLNNYHISSSGSLQFDPGHRSLELANVFAQDSIAIGERFEITAGLKFEDNPYSGWSALPDLRFGWSLAGNHLLWAAASRAIRAPTPFDVDVREFIGPTLFLTGNPDFRNEKLTACEVGYRGQPHERFSVSISAFYDDYEDFRTVEFSPAGLPLIWSNFLGGYGYGFEGWANIQVTPWWRLSPGFRTLSKHLEFEPGASGLLGVELDGNDPETQASLKSSMDFGPAISLDVFLRYVGELPDPAHDDYHELSGRLAWSVLPSLELSLGGFNLLDDRHTEYATGAQISRSFMLELRWAFQDD